MTNSVVKVDVIRTGDGVNSIPVGEMISKVAKIPVDDDLATAQDLSDLSLSVVDIDEVAQEALLAAQTNAVHVLSIKWEPSRDIIGAGDAALDGQLLSRATYPDAWAAIEAGLVPTVDDATWLADPTQRGKFTTGNGSTTFRLPDYNGKSAGSLGAVFLRGDGARSAAVAGVVQRDAFQGHHHSNTLFPVTTSAGAGSSYGGFLSTPAGYPATWTGGSASDGVNGTPRTASETRPLNVTGCWVIKLFGAIVNVGSADAAQLASDYANLAGQVQRAYTPNNILGTVSQSGGVPTGAIIERGSNANGEYVRFADGTQICIVRKTVPVITSAVGGGFECGTQGPFNYPAAWATEPSAGFSSSNENLLAGVLGSTLIFYFNCFTFQPREYTTIARLLFIGRWY